MSRKSIKTNKGVELSIIDYDDCLQTEMIAMKILNNEECSIIIESNGFNESNLNLYTTAIDGFLALDDAVFDQIKELLFKAYQDAKEYGAEGIEDIANVEDPDELLTELYMAEEAWVINHPYDQQSVCIKLEFECPWDLEHEICITFKNGVELEYFGTDSHFESDYEEMKSTSTSNIYFNPYKGKKPRPKPEISTKDQAIIDEQEAILTTAPIEIHIDEITLKRNKKGYEYRSAKLKLDVLFGKEVKLELDEYFIDDEKQADYLKAIQNLLVADKSVMLDAQDRIYKYYEESIIAWGWAEGEYEKIEQASDVWKHISFGDVIFSRNNTDNLIYASIESSCSWEEEHGLQIVIREGSTVNKVGPYDGHLTE